MAKIEFDDVPEEDDEEEAPTPPPSPSPRPAPTTEPSVADLTAELAELKKLVRAQAAQPPARRGRPAWLAGLMVVLSIIIVVTVAGLVDGFVVGWWSGGSAVWGAFAQLPFVAVTATVVIATFFWAKSQYERREGAEETEE